MAGSAIIGGVLLGLIEGIGILFTRLSAEQFRNPLPPTEDPNVLGDAVKSSPFGFAQSNTGSGQYQWKNKIATNNTPPTILTRLFFT